MNEQIQHYFNTHPKSNECFTTSDGLIFHGKHNAESYAGTLKDKDITRHEREATPISEELARLIEAIKEEKFSKTTEEELIAKATRGFNDRKPMKSFEDEDEDNIDSENKEGKQIVFTPPPYPKEINVEFVETLAETEETAPAKTEETAPEKTEETIPAKTEESAPAKTVETSPASTGRNRNKNNA
jgi:hypothetical protein